MRFIRNTWLVARWEFLTTVRRAGFLAALIGLPLAHFGLAALIGLSVRGALDDHHAKLPLAFVDKAGILTLAGDDRGKLVADLQAGLAALERGEVEAVYVLEEDYLATGKMRSFAAPPRRLTELGKPIERRERASDVLRRGLARGDDLRTRRVLKPISVLDNYRVERGTVTVEAPFAALAMVAGRFGICFVLALAIFLASGLLQQAMSLELQNRMVEVILSLVTPTQLLAGKVLGLSAAGLLQLSVYLATAALAAPVVAGSTMLSIGTMLWSAAIFLAGYALFATLLAGIGTLVRDPQEHTQAASVCLLLAATPFFFLTHVDSSPPSVLARGLTWFPPTAPVALLLRMGSDSVGPAERAAVLALVVASAVAVLAGSAALLKLRLLSGDRLTLRRILTVSGGRR
jgi:ABC-2 type transport system permease protein